LENSEQNPHNILHMRPKNITSVLYNPTPRPKLNPEDTMTSVTLLLSCHDKELSVIVHQ